MINIEFLIHVNIEVSPIVSSTRLIASQLKKLACNRQKEGFSFEPSNSEISQLKFQSKSSNNLFDKLTKTLHHLKKTYKTIQPPQSRSNCNYTVESRFLKQSPHKNRINPADSWKQ